MHRNRYEHYGNQAQRVHRHQFIQRIDKKREQLAKCEQQLRRCNNQRRSWLEIKTEILFALGTLHCRKNTNKGEVKSIHIQTYQRPFEIVTTASFFRSHIKVQGGRLVRIGLDRKVSAALTLLLYSASTVALDLRYKNELKMLRRANRWTLSAFTSLVNSTLLTPKYS